MQKLKTNELQLFSSVETKIITPKILIFLIALVPGLIGTLSHLNLSKN